MRKTWKQKAELNVTILTSIFKTKLSAFDKTGELVNLFIAIQHMQRGILNNDRKKVDEISANVLAVLTGGVYGSKSGEQK